MSDHLTGFRARLKAGPTAFAAWCGMRDPAVTETILKEGFDCAILDWQHGYHDQTSIESGILVAQAHRKPALVRIGVVILPVPRASSIGARWASSRR